MPESYQQLEKKKNDLAIKLMRLQMKKPYPPRLQLAEKVFEIIRQEIRAEFHHRGATHMTRKGSIRIAGNATERIRKIVQNNYRRRRK